MAKEGILIENPSQELLLSVIKTLPKNPKRRILTFSYKGIEMPEEKNKDYLEICSRENLSCFSELELSFEENSRRFIQTSLTQDIEDFFERKRLHLITFRFNSCAGFQRLVEKYISSLKKENYHIDYARFEIIYEDYPQYKTNINFDKRSGLEITLSELCRDRRILEDWLRGLKFKIQ